MCHADEIGAVSTSATSNTVAEDLKVEVLGSNVMCREYSTIINLYKCQFDLTSVQAKM